MENDLISRQDAIDLVKDVCDAIMSGCESWYDPETEDEVYKDIREVDAILKCNKEVRIALRNMQPAQPEPHWIPCSERLPEEDGQYLITVKYKHVDGYDDIYAEHGEWCDGKWDMFCFGHCGEVEGITAWMPLPEPWGGRTAWMI